MTNDAQFIFLDIETTGLDPFSDLILELGMVATDANLVPIKFFQGVIHWPTITYDNGDCIPPFGTHRIVTDMHTKNGLWQDSYNSTDTLTDVTDNAFEWLQDVSDELLPMTGNTISFDKMFLASCAPDFVELFDYHVIDISSIRNLYQRWNGHEEIPVGKKLHRSIPDCYDSIRELKFFKRVAFNA